MARGFIILSILVAILAVAFGEWAIDTTTSATVLAGVGTSSDDVAVAAASQNGVGSFIENYQNGKWTKKTVQAGLLLDSAITPTGNVVATSAWTVFVSNDGGNTYTSVDGLSGLSQSANVYGPGQEYFGLVGSWAVADPNSKVPTSVSGVATSTDGGKTWSVSSSVPIGYVRYGAFPSENTWYVASGTWAEDSKLRATSRKFQLSKRFEHSLSGASFLEKGYKAAGNETGWFGAVSKTTDAGKTWTQVLITDLEKDALYFNGISCSSDSHCAVVAEGEDVDGSDKTVLYVTFDAGNTWTQSLITQDVGLMQVKFISETEGWAAGTGKSGRGIVGQFYHTNDGGKSWTLQQSLSNCFTLDLDFAATKGYAACCTSSGSSCSAAVYSA